ncbi:Chanoclavine-I aldehyde reductase fgaOx3 [Fusarium oxysporum f. sp. rapae]|uniref:Chanoclavine-I aldehyde reductase fgaOx3 n=1 Tax=Fusarium oxysporum f. sp. rapae TaxID=485398 RepID=A0A8J5P459_FUSOX|nr:Chanoclavine-I aldehyde reductase fgaOx3 [Fusarium oxysporum f. sp. rapae]
MSESRLFQPMRIGNIKVQHRIGMAPLTRLRASIDRVPNALMKEYYGQRASIPGTLIITEGTLVSPAAGGGFARTPGIWNQKQVNAWKEITDEVHRKGSFIFVQLFAMGRAATVEVAKDEGIDIVGPSAIPIDGSPT